MKWVLRGCPVCAGDLHEDMQDQDWLTCFMCARSFPAAAAPGKSPGNGVVSGEAVGRRREVETQLPFASSLAEEPQRAA